MKERIKERYSLIKSELTGTAVRLSIGDASVLTKTDRIAIVIAATLSILLFVGLITQSFAAPGQDVFSKAENIAKTYYGKLFGITTVVAAFLIIIALLWTMLSPTSNGARTPLGWIKKILLVYVVILSLGGIFTLIGELTDGLKYTP